MRLRVRYSECDAQGIVFNARWGEYVDVAATEYTRALFGAPPDGVDLDWRLVKQTTEWHAPAHYDEVIEFRVRTVKLGTTSFVLATEAYRGDTHLVTCETIYVVIDPKAGTKRPIPDRHRALLDRGAPNILVDQSGRR